jgi:hypothetical protein
MSKFKRLAAASVGLALMVPVLVGGSGATVATAKSKSSYVDLSKFPKPKITGAEIISGLEEFVAEFPLRQNIVDIDNSAAAEFLAKEAKKFGYKVRIIEYEAGTPARTVRVVEAIKKGTTKANEWISFVAHYDTIASAGFTVQGAYDDGSGTNMLRYFAKAFSKVKTKRSIAILWMDAEEEGLLASDIYAKEMKKKGQKMTAVMGFDMVGIGYPAPYCICVYHGPIDGPKAEPIIDYVNKDFLGFPMGDGGPGAAQKWPIGGEGHVCNCGPNIRNSDESNFAEQGYFSMRWTGMRTASDYPGYHQPWDTVPFMEVVAGSRQNLEEGTENTFMSAYYTALVLDNLP